MKSFGHFCLQNYYFGTSLGLIPLYGQSVKSWEFRIREIRYCWEGNTILLRGKYDVLIHVTWDCFDQSNFYISRINIIEWNNNFYSLSQCYKGYIIKSFVEQYTSLKTTQHVKNFSVSEYSARRLKVSRWKTNGKGNPQTNNQNIALPYITPSLRETNFYCLPSSLYLFTCVSFCVCIYIRLHLYLIISILRPPYKQFVNMAGVQSDNLG
jgi:hypothetical protein